MSCPVERFPALTGDASRWRLPYLDGLRGLAALYVVFHHAYMEVKEALPEAWVRAMYLAENGQIAVQVFIVLSGYCLMIPVLRASVLKGGSSGFFKRRAWRILPPYYAALLLALAIVWLVPGMNVPRGTRWDAALPATTPGVLISHLVLVQDFSSDWLYKIDPPMWTISQEWQIYFVFAFLLLPIWRRAGILSSLLLALAVSLALRHLPGHDLTYASPEFLFQFAAGMFAAAISFAAGPSGWLAAMRERVPWVLLTATSWPVYLILTVWHPERIHSLRFAVVAAGAVLSTLVLCTNSSLAGQRDNYLLRLCEWAPVVRLGMFSYSLYLVHYPVLSLVRNWSMYTGMTWSAALAWEFCAAVPLAIVAAFGFHLLVERPFLAGPPRH